MNWLHQLGRLLGVIGLVGGILPFVLGLADSNVARVVLSVAWMGGCLGIAVFCSRGLVQNRARQAQEDLGRGQVFVGAELRIGLRWFHCVSLLAVFLGMTAFSLAWGMNGWNDSAPWWMNVLVGFIALLGATVVWSLILVAFHAVRNAAVMRVDGRGMLVAGASLIAWDHIRGVDLREQTIKGRTRYSLSLAVDPGTLHAGVTLFGWQPGRLLQLQSNKVVAHAPLALMAESPEFIVEACRVLGVRHGSRFLPHWRESAIFDVAHYEDMAERARMLDEMLGLAGWMAPEDLARMSVQEQKQAMDAMMKNLARLRAERPGAVQ